MKNNFVDALFDAFGKQEKGVTLPASNSPEENIIALADHYDDNTLPGHGMFFDFDQTPDHKANKLQELLPNNFQ